MPVSVDIVLPCYKPHDTWTEELLRFHAFIRERYEVHYIVVNDGSDEQRIKEQIASLENNRIPVTLISYEKNRGKGYALRKGVAVAKHPFIVYTDIDFPFTNESTAKVISMLVDSQYDIVTGYRDTLYYQKKMTGFRKALSRLFRFFIKDILRMAVSDTQCGLKGFNAKGRRKFLATRIDRYLFDFEFIYLSGKDPDIRITPVEVQLKDNVVFSKMRLKVLLQESFNLLAVLLRGGRV